MTKPLMREPWTCQTEPRTHSRVEVEGTDEVTSQRYLALTALEAPQNLPQHLGPAGQDASVQRANMSRSSQSVAGSPGNAGLQLLPRSQLIVLACLAAVCVLYASPALAAASDSERDSAPTPEFHRQYAERYALDEAASGSELNIAPTLFFAKQPKVRGLPAVGQTLTVALGPRTRAYRASRWRWRRAASPQPLPQAVETVADPGTGHYEYVIQPRDAGYFLSACIQLAVTRDIVAWYCTSFVGPIDAADGGAPTRSWRSLDAPPCADLASTGAVREANADPPPLARSTDGGRWRLLPALDGRRWHDPVDLLPWPAGGWAVAERAGRILRHQPGQTPCLLLDLAAEVGPLGTENGLLNLALDPQFPAAPFLYVYYTRAANSSRPMQLRLARFPVAGGRLRREAELVLLETVPRPNQGNVHFGGALGFGPDGLLYLGLGDRQAPEQVPRLDSLLGKILRLDVRQATRARPYRIPAANPWRGQAEARPEAYARGFRNPWRLAFDPRDGALWVADVGQGHREEVNRMQAGADYGWPLWEGNLCHGGGGGGVRGLRGAPRGARRCL